MTDIFSKPMAETNRLPGHFRRTDPRYDRELEVEIRAGETQHAGRTRNISLGGLLAETATGLPVGTQVAVRFRVPTQPEILEVTGEVRWLVTEGSVNTLGIRFQGLRAREVWALNRFFQS